MFLSKVTETENLVAASYLMKQYSIQLKILKKKMIYLGQGYTFFAGVNHF